MEIRDKIQKEIKQIKQKIPENVTLIAVSKTKPQEYIQYAIDAGQHDFGENYVKELVDKSEIYKNVIFHFIGHLQSNKIPMLKLINNLIIHTVDSFSLAQKIAKAIPSQKVFLQINISNEEQKSGFSTLEIKNQLEQIKQLKLQILGFMCIGEAGQAERDYKNMNELRNEILPEGKLSMGMSHDWEIAVKHGSEFLRVGTQIFGERDYTK